MSKVHELRAKFRNPYKKSGSESKKMTSDFALELNIPKIPQIPK